MGVPWPALLPLGIVAGLFVAGTSAAEWIHRRTNNGKPPRYRVSPWEEFMMQRDVYITGNPNVQKVPYWNNPPTTLK